MSVKETAIAEIENARQYLERSTRVLTEEHSGFAPSPGIYTVAQQMAHIATVLHWFVDGTFGPNGFSLEFEAPERQVRAVTSLTEARRAIALAFEEVLQAFRSKTDAELEVLMPEGSLIPGPKWGIAFSIADHTAHHRGALTIYSRALGLTPPMPYMEM